MERSVTFRFYRVERHSETDPAMVDVLNEIAKIPKKSQREREIATDFVVRLEEFEKSGPDAVVGEIIRVQSKNMPSEVLPNGRSALTTSNPLGHGIVFRFNHKKSILCIQHDARIASCGRFIDYVKDCWPSASFGVLPMIKPKSWERFNSGSIRKLAIRIARPEHLSDTVKGHQAAAASFKSMAAAYEAPSVKIELSMGAGQVGALSESVKSFAKSILAAAAGTEAAVLSMRAVAYVDDEREEIDLIEERLKATETVPLDDRDPAKNYSLKKAFITKVMKAESL